MAARRVGERTSAIGVYLSHATGYGVSLASRLLMFALENLLFFLSLCLTLF